MKRKAETAAGPIVPVATLAPADPVAEEAEVWALRLYVAGKTTKSITAIANLKRLCADHLPGRHTIEVIDLVEHPELARSDQIFALPTLVRKLPNPIRKVIGDLSNVERVLVGLQVLPAQPLG